MKYEKIGSVTMFDICTTRLHSEHRGALVVTFSLLVFLYIFSEFLIPIHLLSYPISTPDLYSCAPPQRLYLVL